MEKINDRPGNRDFTVRILAVIQNAVFFRNFVSSGALSELANRYEVILSSNNPDVENYPLPAGLRWGPRLSENKSRNKIRYYIQEFVMCGLRTRCRTFGLKLYRLSWRKRFVYRLVATPWSARALQRLSEWWLGSDPEVDRLIKDLSPQWVLLPSSCEDSLTADLIKAARQAGARSLILVNGWDNLTSKGTIPVVPDKIGVWGPQAKEDALRIHDVSENRIVMLGAPHFESYFKRNGATEDTNPEIRRFNGIPDGKRVILFGGCLQPFDEVSALRLLEKAIEAGTIPNAHVLYRPHPWRHSRAYEDPFKAEEFRHVSLDQQVAEVFLKVKRGGDTGLSKKHFPDLSYYPKLIRLADFVISPLSTFVLESLLMGKRTIAICYSDGRHYFSADKVSQYEHVQCLQGAAGIQFCRDPNELPNLCRQFFEPVDEAHLYQKIREHLRYILLPNDKPYADRLAQECNAF